jgi:LacI family transcriptional regulator
VVYIPLIIHAADNEYNGEIIRGITEQLDPHLYQVTIHLTHANPEIEARHISVAKQIGSEGLLIVNSQIPESELAEMIGKALPYVIIDYYADLPSTPAVRATNWQGARHASDYLIVLGHRRIGVITGRENDKVTQARKHGYHSSLLEAGLPFDAGLLVAGDYSWKSGFQAASALLTGPNPPTALLIFSDLMAMGAVEAIRVAGLRIPDDISLIAFDDLPTLRQIHPPLTTIRQPFYEMARMAARMLVDLINGQEVVSQQIVLPSQLIERASCGPAPGTSA